jgi:alpha-D-xyloside xylohydrolase
LNGVWAGDQPGTFTGLRAAIRMAQTAGVSGFPIWGSDIGGYHSAGLTPEVFVRWAQFAAVTPIFEVGGVGQNARFWTFGPRTVELFRRAAELHYELFPHLYELARRAARTGLPIVRPLALDQPADDRSWSADLEFLVGGDLLVAPVAAASGSAHRIYLPEGEWVDVTRGTRHAGGRTIRRPTPLDELPLYLRAGTAVPFNARTPAIWSRPWQVDDLRRPGRAGWLLAPGPGSTTASSADAGSIGASTKGAVLELSLRRAPAETQVVVLTRERPAAVEIGGRRVAASGSAAALRRARTGWMFTRGPRGGVVLKLTGSRGVARVRLMGNS